MARRLTVVLLAALTTACSPNWQPVTATTPRPFPENTVVEFTAGKALVRLHGVRETRDSISGIPWLDHLSCDTCRVSYALANVSGMRTGNPGATAWWIAGPMLGLVAFSFALAIALQGLRT